MKKLGILLTPLLLVPIMLWAVGCAEHTTITSVPTLPPTDMSTSTATLTPMTTPTGMPTSIASGTPITTPTSVPTSTPLPTSTLIQATEAPPTLIGVPPLSLDGWSVINTPGSQAQSSEGESRMFLLIDGIPGESTDDNHKDWIEVVSYNYAISQPEGGAASSAGRTGAGQAQQQEFKIVKYLDKSSPKLALYSCSGKRIKEVTLELCHASGDKQKFMEYKMEDVLISSVNVSGSVSGSETIPVEEVSLEYAKISWTYTEFDNTTGKPNGNVQANWDLTAGKGG